MGLLDGFLGGFSDNLGNVGQIVTCPNCRQKNRLRDGLSSLFLGGKKPVCGKCKLPIVLKK